MYCFRETLHDFRPEELCGDARRQCPAPAGRGEKTPTRPRRPRLKDRSHQHYWRCLLQDADGEDCQGEAFEGEQTGSERRRGAGA